METSEDLAILIPVLGRAELIQPLLNSIYMSVPHADIVFAVTPGDSAAANAALDSGETVVFVEWRHHGDYARKINAAYRATDRDWVFLGATDLKFHMGWYERASVYTILPNIGVIGTNDLGSPRVMRGDTSTHSLVSREYIEKFGTIDEPGKILHEGYIHEWVDDELIETARHRNAFVMASNSYVEHLHPDWGKGKTDDSYADAQRRMIASKPLFNKRRKLWT